MTTITDTQAQFQADVGILNQIVHGDASTTVQTNSGTVKSVAKLLADRSSDIDAAIANAVPGPQGDVGPQGPQGVGIGVSVLAHGAVADGVTDDYTAIQAAIDAVKPTGGVVFFPAGTYVVGSGLTLYGHVQLVGQSTSSTVLDFTTMAANGVAIDLIGNSVMDGSTTTGQYSAVRNMTINGSRASTHTLIRVNTATNAYNSEFTGLRAQGFFRGVHVLGQLWATMFYDIELSGMVYPFTKEGSGSCTSLDIRWIKLYDCYHGFILTNTYYSTIVYYYEQCGFTTAHAENPAAEVPVSCHLNGCTNVRVFTGQESSKAIVLHAENYSSVEFSGHLYVPTNGQWVYNGTYTSNIPGTEQGLFGIDSSVVSINNLTLFWRTAGGYPAASVNSSYFLRMTATADTPRVSFNNCMLDVQNYYFTNDEADYPNISNLSVSNGSDIRATSLATGSERVYTTVVKSTLANVMQTYNGLGRRAVVETTGTGTTITIPITSQGNINTKFTFRLLGVDGAFNTANPKPIEASFAFGSLDTLSNVTSWGLQGVSSVAASTMNIVITLSASMTTPTLLIDAISPVWDGATGTDLVDWNGITVA